MADYFDICGTHIAISKIKNYRVIKVEYIYRPVFQETRKSFLASLSGKRYEFAYMEPYAAIIGQQGQKTELGQYKAKTFKEALQKDLSGAVIYTIADKLRLKAFKRQKYQCVNLAGRAFSSYLEDIPARMIWDDGRTAEVFKEDKLYTELNEITMPGVEYIDALELNISMHFLYKRMMCTVFMAMVFSLMMQIMNMKDYAWSKRYLLKQSQLNCLDIMRKKLCHLNLRFNFLVNPKQRKKSNRPPLKLVIATL